MTLRKHNSPSLYYDVNNCQILVWFLEFSNRGHNIAHVWKKFAEKQFKKSFVAKVPINKVVIATFLLNQQNAIFLY